MEISISRNTLYSTFVLVGLLALLGLASLGKSFTPTAEAGEARVMTWSDWQLTKAERRFQNEREILRADMNALAALLNTTPDPVAAQLLAQRIGRHTSAGEAVLQPARTALLQAAQDVASWSAGVLDRDTATTSLQAAATLLK